MSDAEAVKRFREYNFDADTKWRSHLENLAIFDEPGSFAYENKLYRMKKKYYHSKIEPITSILGEDDYKQHVTYGTNASETTSNASTSTSSSNTTQNEPTQPTTQSTNSSARSTAQPVEERGFVALWIRKKMRSLSVVMFLNLMIFVLGVVSVVLSFLAPYASLTQMLYRQTLITCAMLYGGTQISNEGLSFTALKEAMQNVYGLYTMIILIFLTSSPNILFIILMTAWALSQLPSLLQRYATKHNITNPTLQNAIQKGLSVAPQVPYAAARMELMLFFFHIISLFGADRHILRTLMVFNFIVARYTQSPMLQMQVHSLKRGLDSLAYHPKCPSIITNVYSKINNLLWSYLQRMQQQ